MSDRPTEYDALLLDMDGVLVEPTPGPVLDSAVSATFEAFDVDDPDPEAYDVLRSLSAATPQTVDRVGRTYDVDTETLWRMRERIAADRQIATLDDGGKRAYDDVVTLRAIEVPVGVVSNNQQRTVDAIVSRNGLDRQFDAWSGLDPTVEGLRRAKPAPCYIEAMLDKLDAETALFVGDSLSDVHAAQLAGIDSALLCRNGDSLETAEIEPTYELASLSELAELMHSESTTDDSARIEAEFERSSRAETRRSGSSGEELLTLARLNRPTVEERIRFAVVADPHVSPDAAGTPKLYHQGVDRLKRAFADAESRDIDAVLSVGDLTKDGAPEEYTQFDECLDDLSVPFFSVPGNHDVPKASTDVYQHGDDHETPAIDRFVAQYTTGELPFHLRLGGIDILGLNSASTPDGELSTSHDGKVSSEQLEWLDDRLGELDSAVVLMHHNTPQMYEQLRSYAEAAHPEMGMPPTMREPDRLVETLQRHDVPLVLSGHLHIPGVAETETVRELTVPATCSYPQGYALVDIGPNGTVIEYVPVAAAGEMAEAHAERRTGGDTSQGLSAFSAIRLASAPLLDDWVQSSE